MWSADHPGDRSRGEIVRKSEKSSIFVSLCFAPPCLEVEQAAAMASGGPEVLHQRPPMSPVSQGRITIDPGGSERPQTAGSGLSQKMCNFWWIPDHQIKTTLYRETAMEQLRADHCREMDRLRGQRESTATVLAAKDAAHALALERLRAEHREAMEQLRDQHAGTSLPVIISRDGDGAAPR